MILLAMLIHILRENNYSVSLLDGSAAWVQLAVKDS